MKVGINTRTIYNSDQSPAQADGLGVYTKSLIKSLSKIANVGVTELNLTRNSVIAKNIFPDAYSKIESTLDVFHSTDYVVPKLKRTPIIATIHDAIFLKYPEMVKRNNRKFANALLKQQMQHAQHYIAISEHIIPDIEKYWGIERNKISVVHNGIDPIFLQDIPQATIKQTLSKYLINKPFFLAVGTIQPRKNIERIVEAFLSSSTEVRNNSQLVIVGKNGFGCDTLIEKLQQLQPDAAIKWLKHIPFTDLRALYQASLAITFPSLAEGFGLPIIEGFASKTPVITSNLSCMPEIAADAALLVDPHSTESIRVAMEKLYDDTELHARLTQKGIIRAADFSWDKCAQETLAVYKSIL